MEAYGILIDESSRAAYDKSLNEGKKARARPTEEPQQKYANPKSQAETLFMTAQVMIKLHERGRSWLEIIKLVQEDRLSQENTLLLLVLCFKAVKATISHEEIADIARELHPEGADLVDIVDLIQKAGYSEKMAYKVVRDIAAKEQKRERIRSKGSTWLSLLDALMRGLSSTGPRKAFTAKQNYSQNDGDHARRSRSRYY